MRRAATRSPSPKPPPPFEPPVNSIAAVDREGGADGGTAEAPFQ